MTLDEPISVEKKGLDLGLDTEVGLTVFGSIRLQISSIY